MNNIIISVKTQYQVELCRVKLEHLYATDEFDDQKPSHLRIRQIDAEYEHFKVCLVNWFDCGGDAWYEQAAQLLANIRCLLRRI